MVWMTRSSRKPALFSNCSCSLRLRCLPPTIHSMMTSMILDQSGPGTSAMRVSITSTRACGSAAFRTADRSATVCSSSQSWMTSMIR